MVVVCDQRQMVSGHLQGRPGSSTYRLPENRISITYGHPYMIEVQDCDARLPSSGDATDLYLDQLVRLSVIVGRVQKNIYTYVARLGSAAPCFILTVSAWGSAARPASL